MRILGPTLMRDMLDDSVTCVRCGETTDAMTWADEMASGRCQRAVDEQGRELCPWCGPNAVGRVYEARGAFPGTGVASRIMAYGGAYDGVYAMEHADGSGWVTQGETAFHACHHVVRDSPPIATLKQRAEEQRRDVCSAAGCNGRCSGGYELDPPPPLHDRAAHLLHTHETWSTCVTAELKRRELARRLPVQGEEDEENPWR